VGKISLAGLLHVIAVSTTFALLLIALVPQAYAHRSGCHRWHSCPSDDGSYVCGDTGHCSGCPDNQFCVAGKPLDTHSQESKLSSDQARPGVPPNGPWTCPAPHDIKGNFTTYSGERCIFHLPGGQFYTKTKPERCYATEVEATQDGCRRSRR